VENEPSAQQGTRFRALALGRMAYRCLNPHARARPAVRSVRPELDALCVLLAGREGAPGGPTAGQRKLYTKHV